MRSIKTEFAAHLPNQRLKNMLENALWNKSCTENWQTEAALIKVDVGTPECTRGSCFFLTSSEDASESHLESSRIVLSTVVILAISYEQI